MRWPYSRNLWSNNPEVGLNTFATRPKITNGTFHFPTMSKGEERNERVELVPLKRAHCHERRTFKEVDIFAVGSEGGREGESVEGRDEFHAGRERGRERASARARNHNAASAVFAV